MRRRVLGWGLIVYGIAGLVLIVAGAITGLDVADRVERLATDADGTLSAASRATRAASESFGGVDGSLASAADSADDAAALARRSETTLDALAAAMELSFFGAQPLLPLAGEFSGSADLAGELAGTLDEVRSSLGDTRTDVAEIGTELALLSDELDALRSSTGGDDGAPPIRLFVALLLAWLAVPALGSLIWGLVLVTAQDPGAGIREPVE